MSTKKIDPTLQRCNELIERLQELKKALTIRKPVNALGVGWTQDPSTGAFHHGQHGVISTFRNPEGGFTIKHHDVGTVAHAPDINSAGEIIRRYVTNLKPGATGMRNISSPNVPKYTQWQDMATSAKSDLSKSSYGPKGAGLYDPAASAKRKAKNVGEQAGAGPNVNVKSYSSKPGQLSAKQQATQEAKRTKKLSGPVKQYTPEQIAALEEARKLKKNVETEPWMGHGQIPNADEEVTHIQKTNPAVPGEDAMAAQLANMMQSKAMMRPDHRQPTSKEMIMAGQAMGLVLTEEMAKAQEQKWGNTMNWLQEAVKPISSRFASEEEELAYWSSIKVNGGNTGGDYGF